MYKLYALIMALCAVALVLAEPRIQQMQQLRKNNGAGVGVGVGAQHPYLFLSQVPRGRSGSFNVQGFEIVEESNDYDDDVQHDDDGDDDVDADSDSEMHDDNDGDSVEDTLPLRKFNKKQRAKQSTFVVSDDDSEANNDDDDDDDNENDDFSDSELSAPVRRSQLQKIIKNAKATQMMVAREHAGAIMVPDGIIEIEGQSVVDEKTGKAALIVPRAALDAIPDGSVVALMERSANAGLIADFNALQKQQQDDDDDDEEEERANRVIVRRRRKGGRRNVRHRRRGYNARRRPNYNRRRQGNGSGNGGNRRRNNNVRVINASVNRRRRGNNGAVVRPIVLQD